MSLPDENFSEDPSSTDLAVLEVPEEYNRFSKSNILIGAKYKSSLLENKIMAISLAHIQSMDMTEDPKTGAICTKIKAADLRRLLNGNSGSFYKQLNQTAQSMTGKTIGFSSPEKRMFDYIAVIIRAHYEDGVLTLEYNPHIKKYIKDLKTNFTILGLDELLKFKNVYSFRLYELLRSRAYHPKNSGRTGNTFKISFKLSELKLNLGVVNAELDKVKKILNNSPAPDYDKAVELSPERTLETWRDFKRCCLDKATHEINAITNMNVEYEAIKGGVGSKVYAINFIVTLKDLVEKNVEVVDKDSVLDDIRDMIREKEDLRIAQLRAIAEAADYDINKVQKAYEITLQTPAVDDFVAFMIAAIKNSYEKPNKRKKASPKQTSDAFRNFEERTYDYSKIEEQFAKN